MFFDGNLTHFIPALSTKKFMSTESISQLTLESFFPLVLAVTLFANSLSDSDALKSI